jgi:hypothetical protein
MAGRINELKALIRGAAGDIEPRLERGYCYEISDKARAIGGGVLEAILGASIDLKLPSD